MSIPHRQCKTQKIITISHCNSHWQVSIPHRQCKTIDKHKLSLQKISSVSIPHRQCKTTALISFFSSSYSPSSSKSIFSLKKYVDLFYVRIAVTRAFTGFADIFLHSENLMLRSTYFLCHFNLFSLDKTSFWSISQVCIYWF